MVAGLGVEPRRPFGQRVLSPQRLPIPPPGHRVSSVFGCRVASNERGIRQTPRVLGGLLNKRTTRQCNSSAGLLSAARGPSASPGILPQSNDACIRSRLASRHACDSFFLPCRLSNALARPLSVDDVNQLGRRFALAAQYFFSRSLTAFLAAADILRRGRLCGLTVSTGAAGLAPNPSPRCGK